MIILLKYEILLCKDLTINFEVVDLTDAKPECLALHIIDCQIKATLFNN